MKALVESWLNKQDEKTKDLVGGYIEDTFYRALEWVLKQVGESIGPSQIQDGRTIVNVLVLYEEKNCPLHKLCHMHV